MIFSICFKKLTFLKHGKSKCIFFIFYNSPSYVRIYYIDFLYNNNMLNKNTE